MKNKRNIGIEIFRMQAVFFVMILHICGRGGILNTVSPGSLTYYSAMALEFIGFCAVNCFGLISGYVGISGNDTDIFNYIHRYLRLWFQVFFYSALLSVFWFLIKWPENTFQTLSQGFIPVLSGFYWYFTAYTGMYFFIPILNTGLRNLNKKLAKGLLVLFLLSPLYLQFADLMPNALRLSNGYSALWLIYLYCTGALLKVNKFFQKLNYRLYLLFALACSICSLAFHLFFLSKGNDQSAGLFMSYVSPFIVWSAVFYLVFYSKRNFSFGKGMNHWILKIASSSFGIYLFQDQVYMRAWMENRFANIGNYSAIHAVLSILFIALIYFIIGCIVDQFREWLVKKTKFDHLIYFISKLFSGLVGK